MSLSLPSASSVSVGSQVAGATGIEYDQLSTSLDRLSRLRLVERRVPVTDAVRAAAAERSDLRVYSLADVVAALADERQ